MEDRALTHTELMAQLLSGRPEYDFDEVLASAKMEVLIQRKQAEKEFGNKDISLKTLSDLGCNQNVLSSLMRQESGAQSCCLELIKRYGKLNVLPVIPRSLYGLYGLVSFVRNNGQASRVELGLDPRNITDTQRVPRSPYYCLDVDLGEETQGMSFSGAQKHIKKRDRLPLTVDELLALCTHTKVLLKRAVCALGSNGDNQSVPCMILRATEPNLILFEAKEKFVKNDRVPMGMPSCARRYHDPSRGWLVYKNVPR